MANIFKIDRTANTITLGTTDTTINIASHTASLLLSLNASKNLESVSDLTVWIAGTSNQITVTDDTDGTVTLSTPQDIHTGASPTFAGLTITDDFYIDATNQNVFIGTDVFNNAAGEKNVGIGYQAGYLNTTGAGNEGKYNTYIGRIAGYGTTNNTGYSNVAAGYCALCKNTSGYTNVAVGANCMLENTGGYENTAVGYGCMYANTTGVGNVAVGALALNDNTDGNYNMSIGKDSLTKNQGGDYNVAIGPATLNENVSGNNNVALGYNSLFYNTANDNVGIGRNANFFNASGIRNVCIGPYSGQGALNQNHNYNTFIGSHTGYRITTGNANIFIGYMVGYRQTTNSNLLIIDNQIRVDAATELTNSILYGVMAATPVNQTLRINAALDVAVEYNIVCNNNEVVCHNDKVVLNIEA